MNTDKNKQTGNENQAQNNPSESGKASQISQPQIERAEGPFEHSGETSGWTEEEKKETEEKTSE